ncbi:MAG: hypothetical protein KDC71_10340 [Acidobacteria bacterium]|nr:hypothetical protein [Acidobacteriota bacterium]
MTNILMSISNNENLLSQPINGFDSQYTLEAIKQLNSTISPGTITLHFGTNFNLNLDASLFNSWSGGIATLQRLTIAFLLPNGEGELATQNPVELQSSSIQDPQPYMDLIPGPIQLSTSITPPPNISIPANNKISVALKTIPKPKGTTSLTFEYSVGGILILPKQGTGGIPVLFSFDPRMVITD